MSSESAFTTALGPCAVRISFDQHESSVLFRAITDFLDPVSSSKTPGVNVHVRSADAKKFPSRYLVNRTKTRLGFHSPDFEGDFDLERMHVQVAVPDTLDLRHHFKGKSLRPLWSILAGLLGLRMMHAAAIARDGYGLLIVGNSGRGKTTLAATAARHGWELLSEDTTPVSVQNGEVCAYSLYSSISFTEDEIARQGLTVAARLEDHERGKRVFHFADLADRLSTLSGAIPIRKIISLTGFSDQPEIRSSTSIEALRHIAPSTVLHDSMKSPTLLRDLSEVVRNAETYSMNLGPHRRSNVERLNALCGLS